MLSSTETETAWSRLAQHAKARREELGMTQRDAAVRAGLSTNGYRAIEEGSPVRPSTLEAAERALRWTPGSARQVLVGGGEPVPLPDALTREPVAESTLPIAVEAELATGQVIDAVIRDYSDGLRVISLAVADCGISAEDIRKAYAEFGDYVRACSEALGSEPRR